jgi:hypothetical protein
MSLQRLHSKIRKMHDDDTVLARRLRLKVWNVHP